MKLQLLPSTIENGQVTPKQHLSCFVIDDRVTIDAGSLAISTNAIQKKQIRDVILTHAHIDHIAGLPLFIDDLFADIVKPLEIYATKEVIHILKEDIFNWDVYPDFAELENENGVVLQYCPFEIGIPFLSEHLQVKAIPVNHKVPAVGFVISDGVSKFAISGDTAEMNDFWNHINQEKKIDALLIECAFPNKLSDLARVSHHMTPQLLKKELGKFKHKDCPIYVINMKPMYFQEIIDEINQLKIENLEILEVNRVYDI
jgi:ribonuclease BN (tRNA processing enzyme)